VTLILHYMPERASMAVHMALAEADVPYTLAEVEEDAAGHRPAAYLALNPWAQVPTLEDGDQVLTEAAAIVLHVADRFPEAGLGAAVGTPGRSELYGWLAYLSTTVQTAYMRWFYPERFTTDASTASGIRVAAEAELDRHFDWIDAELGARHWLIAGGRTCADLYLFMLTYWGGHGLARPPRDIPGIGAHYRRLLERPGVRRALAEEGISAR
jgi:glutathione S-transferase